MTSSVLGNVTLGFEFIWNQKRQCAGLRLFVESLNSSAVSARQLLEAISNLWPDTAPILLLNVQTLDLLGDLLDQPPTRGTWLEIPDICLGDAALTRRMGQANQRGWHLVWSGPAGHAPPPHTAAWFHKNAAHPHPTRIIDGFARNTAAG